MTSTSLTLQILFDASDVFVGHQLEKLVLGLQNFVPQSTVLLFIFRAVAALAVSAKRKTLVQSELHG